MSKIEKISDIYDINVANIVIDRLLAEIDNIVSAVDKNRAVTSNEWKTVHFMDHLIPSIEMARIEESKKNTADITYRPEPVVRWCNVYGDGCIGCLRTERDVMISFRLEGEVSDTRDFVLTNEQALDLSKKIKQTVGINKV